MRLRNVPFVCQEERRASDTVFFFTNENNDTANESVNTSFFTSGKNRMTNELASLARRDRFYLDAFWRVNLGMYIINYLILPLTSNSQSINPNQLSKFCTCVTNLLNNLNFTLRSRQL